MLVLTRKRGQSILIDKDIEVYIISVEGETVKLGVRAPSTVTILRKELADDVKTNNYNANVIGSIEDIKARLKI